MKAGFRAAMTWLHDWTGLMLGWLLFVIALAGTLSVFRAEIGDWARPEAACCVTDTVQTGAAAIDWLSEHAPKSPAWYIRVADDRSATSYGVWAEPDGNYVQKWLDARTGSPERVRDTLGGDFFYRLHFELQLPYPWGRLLAGAAAVGLMLVLVTGIVAHRRIFVDFFTFRPGKGQRSWLDAHNLLGVTALPFHLMIAFTGAVTLATLIMPWGAGAAYGPTMAGLAGDLYPAAITRAATGRPSPLAPIRPMLEKAARRFDGRIAAVNVFNPGDAAAIVSVFRAEDERINFQAQLVSFDGVSGRVLAVQHERRPAVATYGFLYGLHTARFAASLVRWLYFLSGLALAGAVAAGLLLWTAKRTARRHDVGLMVVQRLNAAVIGSTPIAFATFFLANRLLPATMPGRAEMEVQAVFWAWGGLILLALICRPAWSWRMLTALTALMWCAIPLVDLGGGTASWSTPNVVVNLGALVTGAAYGLAAAMLWRRSLPRKAGTLRRAMAAA